MRASPGRRGACAPAPYPLHRLRAWSIPPRRHRAPTRVALVHDFLLDVRGAERVFMELCEMWPQADIFTAVYDEDGNRGAVRASHVHSSFLQRLRPSARTFRALLPLYPAAIESFDLSGYELVVSSSSAWAHAVLCDEQTVHVSYCHNPFRYAWNDRERTLARSSNPLSSSGAARRVQALAAMGLDRGAADRPLHRQLTHDAGAGSAPTSAASRTSSTRRSTPSGSCPARSASTTRSSPS